MRWNTAALFENDYQPPGICHFGGPSGSSGSGGGSTANVYTPRAQGAADTMYQDIVRDMLAKIGTTGAGSPAGWAYPQGQRAYGFFDPFTEGTWGTGAANTALAGANAAADMGTAGARRLYGAGSDILTAGFDPQRELFRQTQQRLLDQSNVANAMAGLGGTPYGASVNANALGNFDINWENNLLDRMTKAGGAANPLLTGATSLYSTSSALPYTTGTTIGGNAIDALSRLTQLGNNQYLLPQQIIGNLKSYLGLGQQASDISGQLGQRGFDQTASGIGGALSGANLLFGSSGLLPIGGMS